jgi:hypothetical protein
MSFNVGFEPVLGEVGFVPGALGPLVVVAAFGACNVKLMEPGN